MSHTPEKPDQPEEGGQQREGDSPQRPGADTSRRPDEDETTDVFQRAAAKVRRRRCDLLDSLADK